MIFIEGHAIVSKNGHIADIHGNMPSFLRNDIDWAQFQAALDRASIVVMGRKGHEKHQNRGRKRLVVTRQVKQPQTNGLVTFWNPSHTPFEALKLQGIIAVAGVFDLFIGKYDAFVLAEVPQNLEGIPCFSEGHPRDVLHEYKQVIIHKDENLLITHFK